MCKIILQMIYQDVIGCMVSSFELYNACPVISSFLSVEQPASCRIFIHECFGKEEEFKGFSI